MVTRGLSTRRRWARMMIVIMAAEQRILRFVGDVQGVGFRYTACRVAAGHAVAGYVRNCPDGSVECVVEGETDEVEAFTAELSRRMSRYIRKTTCQKAPANGQFDGFDVRY